LISTISPAAAFFGTFTRGLIFAIDLFSVRYLINRHSHQW
jgi:hypothetical protein